MTAETINYDDLPGEIERLHHEAEDLRDIAKATECDDTRETLVARATAKIRQAARLRAQMGDA